MNIVRKQNDLSMQRICNSLMKFAQEHLFYAYVDLREKNIPLILFYSYAFDSIYLTSMTVDSRRCKKKTVGKNCPFEIQIF